MCKNDLLLRWLREKVIVKEEVDVFSFKLVNNVEKNKWFGRIDWKGIILKDLFYVSSMVVINIYIKFCFWRFFKRVWIIL